MTDAQMNRAIVNLAYLQATSMQKQAGPRTDAIIAALKEAGTAVKDMSDNAVGKLSNIPFDPAIGAAAGVMGGGAMAMKNAGNTDKSTTRKLLETLGAGLAAAGIGGVAAGAAEGQGMPGADLGTQLSEDPKSPGAAARKLNELMREVATPPPCPSSKRPACTSRRFS